MSEKTEITFMQTRLIRLASEEWHLPVEQIIHLFKEADVLGYIEKCYEIFHCEGDEAVLEDITEFLQGQKRDIDRFSMFKDRKSTVWWKTKLWCNGPAYIAELYREELKKSGYQILLISEHWSQFFIPRNRHLWISRFFLLCRVSSEAGPH